jgi:hypothetical protein
MEITWTKVKGERVYLTDFDVNGSRTEFMVKGVDDLFFVYSRAYCGDWKQAGFEHTLKGAKAAVQHVADAVS